MNLAAILFYFVMCYELVTCWLHKGTSNKTPYIIISISKGKGGNKKWQDIQAQIISKQDV